ncbi:MAG: class I SAM-dependent DNA methyltransferase [Terriglobia bacterium]
MSVIFTRKGCAIPQAAAQYYKRDFWIEENLKYAKPHFRMAKAARIANRIARKRECDLLDVGCGPAALRRLLHENIHYYGIDIAIHNPAPNLLQADFLESPIGFAGKKFDIILAQGVFEYVGSFQSQKFSEVAQLLNENGRFVVSYVNFDHRNRQLYWPYSNVQSFHDFRESLAQFFHVDRFFPTSHRWHHDEPKGRFMPLIQRCINVNVPFISRLFAVEYFFICSPRAR